MKRFLFILTMCCLINPVITAQTVMSKTEIVCSKLRGKDYCRYVDYYLKAIIIYDDNMKPNHTFSLLVQHSDYDCLERPFPLVYGSAQEVYDLLVRIENFGNKVIEHSISITEPDYNFTRYNWGIMGKRIKVNKTGETEYHNFKDKDIPVIRNKLDKYCKKNKIELKTVEITDED